MSNLKPTADEVHAALVRDQPLHPLNVTGVGEVLMGKVYSPAYRKTRDQQLREDVSVGTLEFALATLVREGRLLYLPYDELVDAGWTSGDIRHNGRYYVLPERHAQVSRERDARLRNRQRELVRNKAEAEVLAEFKDRVDEVYRQLCVAVQLDPELEGQ